MAAFGKSEPPAQSQSAPAVKIDREQSDALSAALREWGELTDPQASALPGGLIHRSFAVRDGDVEYILQRVSPIFGLGIHQNILAVTTHLAARAIPTLRILKSRSGEPYTDLGERGIWRLETRMPGVTFDTCTSPEQARSASALVARFHSALDDLDFDFRPLGIPLHDTALQLRALEDALSEHAGHRLLSSVQPLAEEILAAAVDWEPLEDLPARVVHGDLKFNNVLFAGAAGGARDRALSLIDLDTVSRMPLYAELGDAWRSWCNRRGEDSERAELDGELLRAAALAYLDALEIELEPAERRSLALGVERISLELAARFAADALRESYFGWDATRFSSAGEHNLVRARGQLSLSRQARDARDEWLRLLT